MRNEGSVLAGRDVNDAVGGTSESAKVEVNKSHVYQVIVSGECFEALEVFSSDIK
jgi:hypothetical protein